MFRRAAPSSDPDDVARLRRVLLRLDPWGFWTVELAPGGGAAFAVLGVTGSFVAAPCGLDGYLEAHGRKLLVDGRPVSGYRAVKRAATSLRGKLLDIGASTAEVTPMIVLTRAMAGLSRERGGVHVLRPQDVVSVITSRPRVLDPSTAERLAHRLGPVLVGPAQRAPEEE